VVGVTVDGLREVLGLWVGDGGEGAKYWHQVLSEIRNRASTKCSFSSAMASAADSVNDIWPLAIVQACVLHLVRNTFRYASTQYGTSSLATRTVYTAATEQAARDASMSSPARVASATTRSSACRKTRGPSSCPSWPTTPRSAVSSLRRTRSRACTRGCGWKPALNAFASTFEDHSTTTSSDHAAQRSYTVHPTDPAVGESIRRANQHITDAPQLL
jgi:hypothetical protein